MDTDSFVINIFTEDFFEDINNGRWSKDGLTMMKMLKDGLTMMKMIKDHFKQE